jgi:hypothetical protein
MKKEEKKKEMRVEGGGIYTPRVRKEGTQKGRTLAPF